MAQQPSDSSADHGAWIRLLYMLFFVLVANMVEVIVLVTMIAQFIMQLSTGSANQRLQMLGRLLGAYIQAIIGFLTYDTDTTPYPFNPWSYGSLNAQDDG
ncbi:MAG: DUF4389 domain-containing protein [Candidatus Tectomicrobia bacterium]|nr:DUF4389 domain-containing protein [Candidatus Tectomicrobia bacterium]